MQTAEAPRVVKSQYPAAIHVHVPVIMGFRRSAGLDQAQASRHAEMQDQRAGVEADEDVLGSPIDTPNRMSLNGGFEVRRYGPAQTALAHDDLDHAPLLQGRRDAASRRFYFRELGRVTARARSRPLLDLRFFIGDVLAHDRIEFL